MEHALTSIAVASPLIHVFDAPTLFLDALWLPYRRDRRQLEAAVAAAGPVKAVFAHADVVRRRLASAKFVSTCRAPVSVTLKRLQHGQAATLRS